MKMIPLRPLELALIVLGATAGLAPATAQRIEASAWRFRQTVTVPEAGLTVVELPAATLNAARAGREDLRLLNPVGDEVAFTVLEPMFPSRQTAAAEPVVRLETNATVIELTTSDHASLERVTLDTPAGNFLKRARVEVTRDGDTWITVADGVPFFRRGHAEKRWFAIGGEPVEGVRLTLDDTRENPLPITGATLLFAAGATDGPPPRELPVDVLRREEFAAETVLTLDPGADHLPGMELSVTTPEPLFTRAARLTVRELRNGELAERTLAAGSIYRLTGTGLNEAEELILPRAVSTPGRELLLHLDNGDSSPLTVESVSLRYHPVRLVFTAATAGEFRLLSGHPRIAAPRYDVALLSTALRTAANDLAPITPAALEPTPGYQSPAVLADITLAGAALDVARWDYAQPVTLADGDIHELELGLAALAHARADLGDVRLTRDGHQIPYLLERTELARAHTLKPMAADDSKADTVSRWEVELPQPQLPLRRLRLSSNTSLFQRHLVVYERFEDNRGYVTHRVVASADWSRRPEDGDTLTLDLNGRAVNSPLILETDNGNNPAIALTGVEIDLPVTRLVFKTDVASGGPITLHYGNPAAGPPGYDLALVADRFVGSPRAVATLGPVNTDGPGLAARLTGPRGGPLFWGALGLVVVVLLVVVARLLPKPPPSP